ncbi:MAG: hypothetical protein ACI39B_04350 [Methanobrevibacter smithii]
MSNIESCILDIVSSFDSGGIYNEEGIYVCDMVDEFLESRGITQYHSNTEMMFENPGIEVYSFSCCWIENGELKSLLNLEIDQC